MSNVICDTDRKPAFWSTYVVMRNHELYWSGLNLLLIAIVFHILRVRLPCSDVKNEVKVSSSYSICATPNEAERNPPSQDPLQARKQAHRYIVRLLQ